MLPVGMDVCALPNNNHPEKFLQLDVGKLPLTQVGALMLGQRRWQNRVYVQVGRRSEVGSLACLRFLGQVKRTQVAGGTPLGPLWDPLGPLCGCFVPQTERRLRAPAHGSAITFVDRYLEKHISPHALTSTVKINPLFPAQSSEDADDGVKVQPSWTVEDYHAQTCANLAEYLKVRGHADSRLNECKWNVLPLVGGSSP